MMHAVESDQRTRERVVEVLRERLGDRLLALVLFGSRARGTSRPDSDWDVLAVADHLPDTFSERARLLSEGPRTELSDVAVVLRSREVFTERLQSLSLDIALDGVILYDPEGLAERRLAEVRALIAAEGLCRERTPEGDLWSWRNPRGPWGAWRERLQLTDDPGYRLELAEYYATQARRLLELEMWVQAVDHAQMGTENAAKAVLALIGPVGHTHEPGIQLERELERNRFPANFRDRVKRLSECARLLGSEVHILAAYGDEEARRAPWHIFDGARARDAVALVEEALGLAKELVEAGWPGPTP